jgi:putative tryptophan/tyrosine transport system substrate-binding protein
MNAPKSRVDNPKKRRVHFDHLKRREFITLLGGAAAAWPLAGRAQQPGKLPTIGFLGISTPSLDSQWVAPFVQRLRKLSWIEGRTVAIEYRWAEGKYDRLPTFAAELVRHPVAVLAATGGERRLSAVVAKDAQEAALQIGVRLGP